jgi:phosphopantothenoylcysteine decarboxylase/phosphopantothenate--cysteine ligase
VSIAGDKKRPKLLIGFAAETDDLLANARKKRKNKGADWIVANDVSGPIGESVMGGADNQVTLIKEGGEETWEPMSKIDVAKQLVQRIVDEIA